MSRFSVRSIAHWVLMIVILSAAYRSIVGITLGFEHFEQVLDAFDYDKSQVLRKLF